MPDIVGDLVLGRYEPVWGELYEGDCSMPEHLRVSGYLPERYGRRLYGFLAGPRLASGQVYDISHPKNVVAAVCKNLADQKPGRCLATDVLDAYVDAAMTRIGIKHTDFGIGIVQPRTIDEVLLGAQSRSAKKRMLYEQAHNKNIETGFEGISRTNWRGSAFVKEEMLKIGKPPRFIFNAATEDVVREREVGKAFEEIYIRNNLSIKGLRAAERYKPVEEVHFLLGGFYVVALDDTARDANTVAHDFYAYNALLSRMGINTPEVSSMLMKRKGFSSRVRRTWKLTSSQTSLLSGCGFTSSMNYCTTRLNCWFIAGKLGLSNEEFAVIAEGDDCLFCVRTDAWMRVQSNFDEILSLSARMLRKDLKVESQGYWHEGGHPFCGGNIGYSGNRWWYFPSLSRMGLKATVVLGRDVESLKPARGRLLARIEALEDRFTQVPIGWKIAEVVRRHAVVQRGKILRTNEEHYNHNLNQGQKFEPPNDEARIAFEHVMGVTVDDQLRFEEMIERRCEDDINCDLTVEFQDLLDSRPPFYKQ